MQVQAGRTAPTAAAVLLLRDSLRQPIRGPLQPHAQPHVVRGYGHGGQVQRQPRWRQHQLVLQVVVVVVGAQPVICQSAAATATTAALPSFPPSGTSISVESLTNTNRSFSQFNSLSLRIIHNTTVIKIPNLYRKLIYAVNAIFYGSLTVIPQLSFPF